MFLLLGEAPLITINLGNAHLALYLSQLMYLLVAALVGFIAEFIVGWRLPFGIVGAIIAGLIGIWIVSNLVILIIPGDPVLFGVPLFKALIGAILSRPVSLHWREKWRVRLCVISCWFRPVFRGRRFA